MNSHSHNYTASQIAAALGISKQSVIKALRGTLPTDAVIVRGNATQAWTFDALPDNVRAAIVQKSSANDQSVADYLDACAKPWQPALTLSEIGESSLAAARKLRTALLPALQRLDAPTLTPADRLRLGLEDYRRAFGHEITERHWRRLLDRTRQRAGDSEDFTRLELYLPEQPARKSAATRIPPHESDFKTIADSIQTFANPSAPTNTERAALWSEVFELYEAGAGTQREKKQLRKGLLKFLWQHAAWLASSQGALRVAFYDKHQRWSKSEGSSAALLDGRELKLGKPVAKPIPQDDLDKITWHAANNCGGRVAQAVREFAASGERSGLSDTTLDLVTRPHASKSHVPRRLAEAVKGDVKMLRPYLLGKKAIDDATAHIERDYSKLKSMQVVCADDFTLPVYFHVTDCNGRPMLTRGQSLLFIDVASRKIIGRSQQPERNYNSLVIRTLMNRICAELGLPESWYFERGIWKTAKLVKGEAPTGWQAAHSWLDAKVGWEKLGVRFVHATRARSKPVERVGGLLQDLMEGTRGYCGRDERRDCPLVTKQAMDDFKAGRFDHPGELFLSFDEWDTELGRIIDRYNASSQDGVLQGLSPDEAFEANWPHNNPPTRLDATSWHLVAHYVKQVPVMTNGIFFRIGSRKFVYRNERTGQDRGKQVLAWFDPECPEFVCVTDLNQRNPYLVERSTKVDFLAEPGDLVFEREIAKAAAHSAYPKTRFHVLKSKFAPTFRRNIVDVETAETAQQMLEQRETKATEQKQTSSLVAKGREAYGRLGMLMPSSDRLRPEQPEAARKLAQLIGSDDAEAAKPEGAI